MKRHAESSPTIAWERAPCGPLTSPTLTSALLTTPPAPYQEALLNHDEPEGFQGTYSQGIRPARVDTMEVSVPHHTAQVSMSIMDLVKLDHRRLQVMMETYRLPSTDPMQRQLLSWHIINELSTHMAKEEMVLYPAIRAALGDLEADRSLREHSHLKSDLAELDRMIVMDPGFDPLLCKCMQDFLAHIAEEESVLIPQFSATVTPQTLLQLGLQFESARTRAPTRPHPEVPNLPPYNESSYAAAKQMDMLLDQNRMPSAIPPAIMLVTGSPENRTITSVVVPGSPASYGVATVAYGATGPTTASALPSPLFQILVSSSMANTEGPQSTIETSASLTPRCVSSPLPGIVTSNEGLEDESLLSNTQVLNKAEAIMQTDGCLRMNEQTSESVRDDGSSPTLDEVEVATAAVDSIRHSVIQENINDSYTITRFENEDYAKDDTIEGHHGAGYMSNNELSRASSFNHFGIIESDISPINISIYDTGKRDVEDREVENRLMGDITNFNSENNSKFNRDIEDYNVVHGN